MPSIINAYSPGIVITGSTLPSNVSSSAHFGDFYNVHSVSGCASGRGPSGYSKRCFRFTDLFSAIMATFQNQSLLLLSDISIPFNLQIFFLVMAAKVAIYFLD